MRLVLVVNLLLLGVFVSSTYAKSDVIDGTAKNFDKVLNSPVPVLVEFYAPCAFATNLKRTKA